MTLDYIDPLGAMKIKEPEMSDNYDGPQMAQKILRQQAEIDRLRGLLREARERTTHKWNNDFVDRIDAALGTTVQPTAVAAHLEQSPRSFSTQPCGHCGATDRHYSGCYYAGQRVTDNASPQPDPARLAALRELQQMSQDMGLYDEQPDAMHKKIAVVDATHQQDDARDAARYRWLRDVRDYAVICERPGDLYLRMPRELDAAIDAALNTVQPDAKHD